MMIETTEQAGAMAQVLRKALAEVGFIEGENGHLHVNSDPVSLDGAFNFTWQPLDGAGVPSRSVLWHARETCGLGVFSCLRHFENGVHEYCVADRRFMKDCGT